MGLVANLGAAAWACSCLPPEPPLVAAEESTAVFIGAVVGIDEVHDRGDGAVGKWFKRRLPRTVRDALNADIDPGRRYLNVEFEVSSWFKGGGTARVTVQTNTSGSACGYGFQHGEAYLVYAGGDEGDLGASACSRTSSLVGAEAEVAVLRGAYPAP
ncbi:hypothetical protein ABI59_20300 [Acidobacteria bacterium Mor1]|nr:hypothetical protein ABI59_20300 [Acidobacteria bacterium Mor1]